MKKLLMLFLLPFALFAEELTLEEKVGQVLMVHFHGNTANDEAKYLIQDLKVGNIIYYTWANELQGPEQVKNLSAGLQRLSTKIPLFIAIDQEGGNVSRLQKGFSTLASNAELGSKGDVDLVKAQAKQMGQEMKAVGISINLAPVVDIAGETSVMRARSFGNDPEKVALLAKAAVLGFQESGIIATLKHFPGLGDLNLDTHEDLPILKKTSEEMNRSELIPYRKLAKEVQMVMPGHVMVPTWDKNNCATLSSTILQDKLRKEIGFEGIIISDSLVMQGVLNNSPSIDEACIEAFNAGCDILLLGGKLLTGSHVGQELTPKDIARIHQGLCRACLEGRITSERLDEAVSKILSLKQSQDYTFTKNKEIFMSKAPTTTVIFETTQGNFEVLLYTDKAPKTCENFLGLVAKNYYDGTVFHRVIKEFMIQGGDPTGTGRGGESIWGKKFDDEFAPGLKFDRPGLLAMANAGPNTNGSQFFITTAETPWLTNKHTIFGEVVKGYDIVEKLEGTETDGGDRPIATQKIKKITVKK